VYLLCAMAPIAYLITSSLSSMLGVMISNAGLTNLPTIGLLLELYSSSGRATVVNSLTPISMITTTPPCQ
jgi:hypothetical protein